MDAQLTQLMKEREEFRQDAIRMQQQVTYLQEENAKLRAELLVCRASEGRTVKI